MEKMVNTGGEEYCEREVFQPSCGENEVILMKSAFYGRMAIGKCIKQNYGHIGCKADVLSIIDGFCSGRQSCTVPPNHIVLLNAKAKVCPSDFAAYLKAEQVCLSGGSSSYKLNSYNLDIELYVYCIVME